MTYPTPDEETEILNRMEEGRFTKKPAVISVKDIKELQNITGRIYMDALIKKYISFLVDSTRHADDYLPDELKGYVRMGASPRASISFMKVAKAAALLDGRTYVTPDDVKGIAHKVMRHRIELNYSAVADNISVEKIIDALIDEIPTP